MMITAMTASSKNDDTVPTEAYAHVSELGITIKKINRSLADSNHRRESLTAERGPLVLPARAQKNASAQKRLTAIDEQLAILNREIADDETALSELQTQLTLAQNDVVRAEWEGKRAEVRNQLTVRLETNTASKLQKAVDELAAAIKAANEEDEKVALTITAFSRNLSRAATHIRSMGKVRSHLFSLQLEKLLVIDTRQINRYSVANIDIETEDRKASEAALNQLDDLELVF
jgi:chromosome segregation ATPase